ncbi:hypothetical protein ACFOG5_24885 [Pedobacter fastidiosus]
MAPNLYVSYIFLYGNFFIWDRKVSWLTYMFLYLLSGGFFFYLRKG